MIIVVWIEKAKALVNHSQRWLSNTNQRR